MSLIAGVIVKKLKFIPDERGRLLEILRRDDPFFTRFGQVYMTSAYPGVIKAWHYHRHQVDHLTVLAGMVKMALYDTREDSPTYQALNQFFLGDYHPLLIRIPPLVLHGFKALGDREVLLLNCPTEPYNHKSPDEYRLPADSPAIPYSW